MTLGELISILEEMPQDLVVEEAFHNPHSYRGYYEQLAFQPHEFAHVSDLLATARSALGKTFTGYKGGEYVMDAETPVWVCEYGTSDDAMCPSLGLIRALIADRAPSPRAPEEKR